MWGSFAGDIIGSPYEFDNIKRKDFPLFKKASYATDDTILTVATADVILTDDDYAKTYSEYAKKYPHAGYGGMFVDWIHRGAQRPYNSWGNGSAMRVGPVGYAFDTEERVLREAQRSAEVTHNHPEGIKGAQSTALAIFLARHDADKEEIRDRITKEFGYDLSRTCDEIRPTYRFEPSCKKTVPQALTAFLDSSDFEDCMRLSVSLGGDTDTLACIAGSVAQAYYKKIPSEIIEECRSRLDPFLLKVTEMFNEKYKVAF